MTEKNEILHTKEEASKTHRFFICLYLISTESRKRYVPVSFWIKETRERKHQKIHVPMSRQPQTNQEVWECPLLRMWWISDASLKKHQKLLSGTEILEGE